MYWACWIVIFLPQSRVTVLQRLHQLQNQRIVLLADFFQQALDTRYSVNHPLAGGKLTGAVDFVCCVT